MMLLHDLEIFFIAAKEISQTLLQIVPFTELVVLFTYFIALLVLRVIIVTERSAFTPLPLLQRLDRKFATNA
jgi:hypothetical protein